MSQERSIEIQADSVGKTACPKCGSVVKAGGAPAFSILQCPKCQAKFAAPGKLGGFVLLKEIGRGQMGVTYKAFEKVLGRYVAIKVMRASLGSDPKRVKDFMAEGRALASLDHPNAVRIFSIGQEKGQPYIVMELVNGRSVGHLMGLEKKLSEPRALEIVTGVARALRAASEIGLIHSDVKPDNIVLDEKGRAKLVDFGIARFGPGKLEADAAIGTPYYVAPEQVLRASVDHRTDIYSLGATLFHALAGVPPFPGTELKDVLNARLKRPAPSVMKVCRGLHLETVQVVAKMLEKDPDQRYQNYDELLKDLRKACWAAGAELTQEADDIPLGKTVSSEHESSMGKVVFVLLLLLAAAGAAGAWAIFFRGNGQPDTGSGTTVPTPPGQVAAPVFSPQGRTIAGPIDVRVSCDTPEADIRYTTSGKVPTRKARQWRGAIEIMPGTTLRARAFREGLEPSEIVQSVYGRDSVVLKDVVGIRSEAEAAWKAVQGYDKGQGFADKLEQCRKLYEQANELYRKEAYAPAKMPYKRVLFLCNGLKTLEGTRKTARESRDRARAAIKSVSDFGTVDKPDEAWKPVAATALKARVMFDRGEFVKAYGLWGQVVGQIDQRYKTMLPNVRGDYENALKQHDIKLLKDHGGHAWKAIEVAVHQASQAQAAGRFGQAVTLYKRAKNLLAPAAYAAKTASSGAKMKLAIAAVSDLIEKGHYYRARAELAPVLRAAPKDPALLKFKAKIDAAVEIKIYLKPGAKPEKGGLVMPLRLVVPGRFKMGSPKSESGRANETLHDVEITQPFYMGEYEVTRRQFEHFANSTGYKTAPEKEKRIWCTALSKGKLVKVSGASWKNPGFAQDPDHPVVCVSWEDAMAFCKWLSGRAGGMTVSLPTEAQWEYACRQGTATRFSFGDDDTKLHIYGNYGDGSSAFASGDVRNSDGKATTSSVGSYKSANKFARLYDMHGNAAEWCSDWFGSYPKGADGKAVKDPTGILRGARRVQRGGSWASTPAKCRSAARSHMKEIDHSAVIGFRVVAAGKAPSAAASADAEKAALARRNAEKALKGRVGVGTWETSAEFKDLNVTRDGKQLFALKNFRNQKKSGSGRWELQGGLIRQTDLGQYKFVTFGETNWSNYTLNVKARKLSGKEGFQIRFGDNGKGRFYYFNLGGIGNTKHIIEKTVPGKRPKFLVESDGSITDKNWHDIRVELAGCVIRGYLDNRLVHMLDVATGASSSPSGNAALPASRPDPLPDFCKKFTITAWVATKDKGTIFAKTAPVGKWVRGGKSLYIGEDGHVYYEIKDGGKLRGNMKVNDGKWHHVALVSEGRKHKIFIDGKPKGEGDLNTNVGDPKGSVGKIGFTATDFPKTSSYKGLLDEVCVYNRALSPKDLTATATARKPRDGLVGYWKFESGGRDDSGKGNHAKGTGVDYHLAGRFGKALKLLGRGAMLLSGGK